MKRTRLVIGRKVSVVICGVLLLNWLLFLGAIVFCWVMGGTDEVIRFFREASGNDDFRTHWDPWPFVFLQVFYLFITVGSGLSAIYFRRRMEALK
jgi:hypothetical protein